MMSTVDEKLSPTLAGNAIAFGGVSIICNTNFAMCFLHALQGRQSEIALNVKPYELCELWMHTDTEPYLPTPVVSSRIKFGAHAIALTKSGKHLVVVPTDGSGICIMSFDGTVIRLFGFMSPSRQSISVDSKGLIWTSYSHERLVLCYTEEGQLVDKVNLRKMFDPTCVVRLIDRVIVGGTRNDGKKICSSIIIYERDDNEGWKEISVIDTGNSRIKKLVAIEHQKEVFVINSDICVYTYDGMLTSVINASVPVSADMQGNDCMIAFERGVAMRCLENREYFQWFMVQLGLIYDMTVLPYNKMAIITEYNENIFVLSMK